MKLTIFTKQFTSSPTLYWSSFLSNSQSSVDSVSSFPALPGDNSLDKLPRKKPSLLIRMVWTPILYKILQFRVGAAWLLFVTEIAPKSTSLCVNRIPIRYDFSCRSKSHTVWYEHSLTQHIKKHFQIVISCKRFLFSPFKSQLGQIWWWWWWWWWRREQKMRRAEIIELWRNEKGVKVSQTLCLEMEIASLPSNSKICTICTPRISETELE